MYIINGPPHSPLTNPGYVGKSKYLTIQYNGRIANVWVYNDVALALEKGGKRSANILKVIFGSTENSYQKVILTRIERIRNFVCCLFTLCIYWSYYQTKFEDSLLSGKIGEAADALRHGADPYLMTQTLMELAKKEDGERSLEFYAAQLNEQDNKEAIREFSTARDTVQSNNARKRLVMALPYGIVPPYLHNYYLRTTIPLGFDHLKIFDSLL